MDSNAGKGLATAATVAVFLMLLAAPAATANHPGKVARSAAAERKLLRVETRTLGAAHARQHAAGRRVSRARARCRAKARRKPRARLSSRCRRLLREQRSKRRARGRTRARAAMLPGLDGQWGAPFGIPILAIHAALLPTGKVMWFSYPDGNKSQNTAQAWLWNPATGAKKRVDPPLVTDPSTGELKPANIWCASQSHMADGRLLVVGGNLEYSSGPRDFKGLDKVYTFNPFTETWQEQPNLRRGRWYPTSTLLSDGRSVILGGLDETGDGTVNADVELFTPGQGPVGQVSLLDTIGGEGKPPLGGLYPQVFAMPSGRAMVAGPEPQDTWFMQPPGSPPAFGWQDAPDLSRVRGYGSAVLLPGGTGGSTRVMQIGGFPSRNSNATATTEVFDEAAPGAGWQAGPSLQTARGHQNTVLLPDGSMVSVGGGYGARNGDFYDAGPEHRAVELYDPALGWRTGPPQQENRAYHSTALLLPDGRVISAGDDVHGGSSRDTAEIYSPPYLFRGGRPQITAAPAQVRYGQRFPISSPSGATQAVLVAPGATTHANDMSQRYVRLALTPRSSGFDLTAPANARIAPPGYYMLFILNGNGVPSVAKFVRLAP